MEVYGIGFRSQSDKCYQYLLLNYFKEKFPQIKIQNHMPKRADILIINMDIENAHSIMANVPMPPEEAYVVMIVYEMYFDIIDYLKLADLIIYTNAFQMKIMKQILGFDYKSIVAPLPTGDFIPLKPSEGSCLIYDDTSFENNNIPTILENAKLAVSWIEENNMDVTSFELVIRRYPEYLFGWSELELELKKIDARFNLHNLLDMKRNEWITLVQKAVTGTFFSLSIWADGLDKLCEDRDEHALFQSVKGIPQLSDFLHAEIPLLPTSNVCAWNLIQNDKLTFDEFIDLIFDRIKSEMADISVIKKRFTSSLPLDKLSDLNIVYGAPLNNRYVFSICFRNQEKNIERCILSILAQNSELDFGIVIVDDHSADKSLDIVLKIVSSHPKINVCIVSNRERKYAARNFYNVAHHLILNDETVIVEVDGDDFLIRDQVLDILESYYSVGALKTSGSYTYIVDDNSNNLELTKTDKHALIDFSHPWYIKKCNSWLALRSCKRHLLCKVELSYFMDRQTKSWLMKNHDTAIQPRIIELSENKTIFIPEQLYCYNLVGEGHDHQDDNNIHPFILIQLCTAKLWHAYNFLL